MRTFHQATSGYRKAITANPQLLVGRTCPQTGLPLFSKPDWTDRPCGGDYHASFSRLRDDIIVSRPCGTANLTAAVRSLEFNRQVRQEAIAPDRSYAQIEDFSRLCAISPEARRYYIKQFKDRRHLRALIFCNLSPLLRLGIQLGNRRLAVGFQIKIARDFPEAVRMAVNILSDSPLLATKSPDEPADMTADDPGDRPRTTCPVTGLDIAARPEWTGLKLGPLGRASFEWIGQRILHVHLQGPLQKEDLNMLRQRCTQMAIEWFGGQEPYGQLIDYGLVSKSHLQRHLHDTHRLLRSEHGPDPVVHIGYNLSWTATILAALRRGWVASATPMRLFKLYPEAILTAVDLVNRLGQGQKPVLESFSLEHWMLNLVGYSLRNEVVDQRILHGTSAGFLEAAHIGPIFQIFDEMLHYVNPPPEGYYVVSDIQHLRGATLSARKLYIEQILARYRHRAFKEYIFYGANRLLSAAINLARPLVPFPIRMVKNKPKALELIARQGCSGAANKDVGDDPPMPERSQFQRQVDELLYYIGSINWESDGFDGRLAATDPLNPLRPIYDAIALIKMDLDHLYRERRQAEEEKQHLALKLQNAQKMEAIGTLAGGVAHDLNNILSGLVSYPELLLMDLAEDSPLRAPLKTIQKSGEKAATIVQDLLTLARRGVAVKEVMNLNQILQEYLQTPEYEKLMGYHPGVVLSTDLASDLLNISGSPVHISKTLMNLISNAAEAMPQGGTIHLATSNAYIDRPISGYDDVKEGEYVILKIADTGIGITAEDRKRIFEPFYTKKVMGRSGTGLGMAVVWGTVKDHMGYIDLSSAPDQGTLFTLYFPAVRTTVNSKAQPVWVDELKGHGESILIIDDVDSQREILSGILNKLGYTVAAVSSGEAAVAHVQTQKVDLLVLDMIMHPGIDGFETYRRIAEIYPGQKAVIASGFSESQQVKKTQQLGAGTYVKKPYSLESLGRAVQKELTRCR